MSLVVELTSLELQFAELLGRMIRLHKPVNNPRQFGRSSMAQRVDGAVGEVAFSKWSSLPVDTRIYEGQIVDDGYDFEFSGVGIDVKTVTNMHKDPHLKEFPDRVDKCPIYVLASFCPETPHRVVLWGWCTSTELKKQTTDYGHGLRCYREWKRLRTMETLFPTINRRLNERLDAQKRVAARGTRAEVEAI